MQITVTLFSGSRSINAYSTVFLTGFDVTRHITVVVDGQKERTAH